VLLPFGTSGHCITNWTIHSASIHYSHLLPLLTKHADIHSNRLPITTILYKDICSGNVSLNLYTPIFVTCGSFVWLVKLFLTKETLHKGLSNYLEEWILLNTEPALGNIISCLNYGLGTLWFIPIGYSASPRRNLISRECKDPQCQIVWVINFLTVAPDICGFSEWNLLHVTLVAPRILRWFQFVILLLWAKCDYMT
jgi:hypothetical protein